MEDQEEERRRKQGNPSPRRENINPPPGAKKTEKILFVGGGKDVQQEIFPLHIQEQLFFVSTAEKAVEALKEQRYNLIVLATELARQLPPIRRQAPLTPVAVLTPDDLLRGIKEWKQEGPPYVRNLPSLITNIQNKAFLEEPFVEIELADASWEQKPAPDAHTALGSETVSKGDIFMSKLPIKLPESILKNQDTLGWLSRFISAGIIVNIILTSVVVFRGPEVFPKAIYILSLAAVSVAVAWYICEWWRWVSRE